MCHQQWAPGVCEEGAIFQVQAIVPGHNYEWNKSSRRWLWEKTQNVKVNKDMTNKTQSFSGKRGATKHLSQPTTTSPRTQDQQIINKRTETSHNKAKSTNNPGQNQQTLTRLIRVTKIHYGTTRRTTFLPNNRGSNRRWPNTKLS